MSLQNFQDFSKVCPNANCRIAEAGLKPHVVNHGSYRRRSDSKTIQRYLCLRCHRSFSNATYNDCFGQKKRSVNPNVRALLVSGVSMRQTARILFINFKTVARKLQFLAKQAAQANQEMRVSRKNSGKLLNKLQFDEMESSIHSKCKPVSIPMIVEEKTCKIIGFDVCSMPAKGKLAKIAKEKYGPRADDRETCAKTLLAGLKSIVYQNVQVVTDKKSNYPDWIYSSFPEAIHTAVKGRRGCVTGQGELKKQGFDRLFAFNQTAAMLRAHISRLFRRTWCTSKKLENLKAHLEIYTHYHNTVVVLRKSRAKQSF